MEVCVPKSFRGASKKENVDGCAFKTPQNEQNFKNVLKTSLHKKPFSRITLYADFITVVCSI